MSGTSALATRSALCFLVVGLGFSPVVRGDAQAPSSLPPPVHLTREQDLKRMMDLLKVSGIPAGAVNGAAATFIEADANPYPTLPDPLTMKSGQKVTTAAQWRARRAELLEDFQREIYGRTPKITPKVTWTVATTTPGMTGESATVTKQLVGRVDNAAYPLISVNILATLTLPANAPGPVPVIIQFGANMTPPAGVAPIPGPCPAPAGRAAGPAVPGAGAGAAPARGAAVPVPGVPAAPAGPTWQQQILSRGWGYVVMSTTSVQADCAEGLSAGIIGLVNKGQPRKLDDWGALSAWGWGASRVLDYLETDKAVDAKRVGVQGHSRYGKAALVGMAFDERIAIGYISSSGQGGAKLNRRKYGELIENVALNFPYWMAGNYIKYTGRWDMMPVDSHELIALCAPRPVFISGGNDPGPARPDGTVQANDAWVDPRGSFMAAVAAGPVYRLLGKRDLGTTDFPPIDTAIVTGDLGFRQHTAGHTPEPTWPTFLTFADRYFTPAAAAKTK